MVDLMKKRSVAICSLTWAFTLLLGTPAQGADSQEMAAAAHALQKQFIEAFNKRDVAAVMACYWNSPDLVVYSPDNLEARGWQAVQEAMQATFADLPDFTLEVLESQDMVAGEAVIGWGRWRMTITPPEAEAMVMDGRFTDVVAQRDGQWVYIVDHASAPLPPPPAAPPGSEE